MAHGELTIPVDGKLKLNYFHNGKWTERDIKLPELSPEYKATIEQLRKDTAGFRGRGPRPLPRTDKVECEVEGGKPINIRPRQEAIAAVGGFHNPYNFIQAHPRDKVLRETGPVPTGLGDGRPAGHHRLHGSLYTGWIDVSLRVATPLLIPDAERQRIIDVDGKSHSIFPVRRGSDGMPYLAPTSIKGMLSTAYEAVTNSRLRVFRNHNGRLGKRMKATDGLSLVPARIENGRVVLMTGTSAIQPGGKPQGPLYAAWLPCYLGMGKAWGELATHGRQVWAYVTEWDHRDFHFWNVVELADGTDVRPTHTPTDDRRSGRSTPCQSPNGQWIHGFVCRSGQNAENKHDERVFFALEGRSAMDAGGIGNPDDSLSLACQWRDLIIDYHQIHHDEVVEQRLPRPTAIRRGEWSRHISVAGQINQADVTLSEGTLCYARVEKSGTTWKATSLFPVNIARELFNVSPDDLIHESLKPARSLDELSPADRVFGWVSDAADDHRRKGQSDHLAHKGQLRIGAVFCAGPISADGNVETAIERFAGDGIPLAILSTPKPSQASFYVAEKNGQPVQEKNRGYQNGQQLRHRKVYPHHARVAFDTRYWSAVNDQTVREFRRAGDIRDNQNRSISEWVKIGTTFTFRVHVINLSSTELGALVWMLSLNTDESKPDHFFRIGGGRPLGFGSVSASIVGSDLRTGLDWATDYRSLDESSVPDQNTVCKTTVERFQKTVASTYGKSSSGVQCPFMDVGFIEQFLATARGLTGAVHYPRMNAVPSVDGENFKWFAEAQRSSDPLPLPKLAKDVKPVPYGDTVKQKNDQNR